MRPNLLGQAPTRGQEFDLRRERERQDLSLDQASEQTNIPRRYLEALETGDETVLPAGTFHRQYRRQYLLFLGYPDIAESIESEEKASGDFDNESAPPPIIDESGHEGPILRMAATGFLLTFLVVLVANFGGLLTDDKAPSDTIQAKAVTQSIQVYAVEPTRVTATGDGEIIHNGIIKAGKSVNIQSIDRVILDIADLTTVKVRHNAKRVEPLHNLSLGRRLVFIQDPRE